MGNKDLVTFTFVFVIAFVLVVTLTGCGRPSKLPVADGVLQSNGQILGYDMIREKILAPKCLACHANFGDYASIMASGAVIPKQPEQSQLYLKTSSGQMPKGGSPLSGAEVSAIYEWISAGAQEVSQASTNNPPGTQLPNVPPGTSTGNPGTTPPGSAPGTIEPTYAWIQANVFTPKCIICHRGSSAPAGLDLSSFAGVRAGNRVVVVGNSASSVLYQRIANNSMPPGGPALSAEVKAAIAKWIDDGAMENGTVTGPQPTPPPMLPLEPKFASIQANILTPRCVGCHSSGQASGGVNLQDYASVMRQVRAGRSGSSELYKVLEDNEMPRSGGPLSFTQKETIRQWIDAGAKND